MDRKKYLHEKGDGIDSEEESEKDGHDEVSDEDAPRRTRAVVPIAARQAVTWPHDIANLTHSRGDHASTPSASRLGHAVIARRGEVAREEGRGAAVLATPSRIAFALVRRNTYHYQLI